MRLLWDATIILFEVGHFSYQRNLPMDMVNQWESLMSMSDSYSNSSNRDTWRWQLENKGEIFIVMILISREVLSFISGNYQ